MENVLAYRIKKYLNSGYNIKIKFRLNPHLNEWVISAFLPTSTTYYSWYSFNDFLLGDYSIFGNHTIKRIIPHFTYLISSSFEELTIKMDLMGI
jgi:hypothetical protein